jgi:hypothetical protein
MRENYDAAEIIVAAWRLANPTVKIPTSHGILDIALRAMVEEEGVPKWFTDHLTFADTRIGIRCLELPAILDCAQESCLTSEPNPTYVTTAVKVDEVVCRRILRDFGIAEADARRWGQALRSAADEVVSEDSEHPAIIEAA